MALYFNKKGSIFMIELSNSAPIVLVPGATAVFDLVKVNTGKCTCSRNTSPTGSIKMTSCGIYQIHFSGNISGATAGTPVQLAIAVGGMALPESVMISTPSAADALNNVAKTLYYQNECNEFSRATIVNNGTETVTIGAGATFSVLRSR